MSRGGRRLLRSEDDEWPRNLPDGPGSEPERGKTTRSDGSPTVAASRVPARVQVAAFAASNHRDPGRTHERNKKAEFILD
jgi:hypothetical protein